MRVRMSTDPKAAPPVPDYETREHGLNDARFNGSYNGYFWFGVNAEGPAPGQVRFVWVVDPNGVALSDPSKGKAVFDSGQKENSCMNIQVVFRRS
jgi:hypothetical protein